MTPNLDGHTSVRKLSEFIIEQKLAERGVMDGILADIAGMKIDLPFVLEKRHVVTEKEVAQALSNSFALPLIEEINQQDIAHDLIDFPIRDMERLRAVVIGHRVIGGIRELQIVVANPFRLLEGFPVSINTTISLCICTASLLRATLNTLADASVNTHDSRYILEQLVRDELLTQTQIDHARKQVIGLQGNHSDKTTSKYLTDESMPQGQP